MQDQGDIMKYLSDAILRPMVGSMTRKRASQISQIYGVSVLPGPTVRRKFATLRKRVPRTGIIREEVDAACNMVT